MKKKIVIDAAVVTELTLGLTGRANNDKRVTLVDRVTELMGQPTYTRMDHNAKEKHTYSLHQWQYRTDTFLCVQFDSDSSLELFIGDEDGDSDEMLWTLSAERTKEKKKKVDSCVLTPEQYKEMVVHLGKSPGSPDSQVLYLRDFFSKLLGPINFSGNDSDGADHYGWRVSDAELVLSCDAKGISLNLKDSPRL